MLTREGYPTWPGGAQPKRKIFGHLAIALAAFCQLEEENNLFGTHFDVQYQVHLRKHLSYSTHSASKVKDEQMAENYKAGATLPLSPLTNVPSSATKFGLNSTQLPVNELQPFPICILFIPSLICKQTKFYKSYFLISLPFGI